MRCDIIGELAGVVRIIYAGGGEIGAGGAGWVWAEWVLEQRPPSPLRGTPPTSWGRAIREFFPNLLGKCPKGDGGLSTFGART
jgi:hypothetical protein